jgi:predicted Zn-dependent protease
VQAGSADGKAALILTLASKKTLKEAADEVISAYQLKLLTQGANQTINGLEAYHFTAQYGETSQQQQEQTQILTIDATLIQYNSNIYVFLGMADAADFNAYKSNFTYSASGFKPLTDASKLNVLPERIKIVKVNTTATLANILTQNGIPTGRHEELAIINGMQTSDQISAGTFIKIVEKK